MASLRSLRKEKELLHEKSIILLRQLQLGYGLAGKGPVPAPQGLTIFKIVRVGLTRHVCLLQSSLD